ncbi:MAG: hypothetical protein ACREQ7_09485 [Candidatus Binatia bacterium]
MKKLFLVFATAAALALPASPTFSQQKERPPAKEGHGMMGEGMPGGAMMCPMMGMGGMGMMGGMMGGMGGDPKMMGRTMEMRGEMMMKMGEVMMKYGKLMQQGDTK